MRNGKRGGRQLGKALESGLPRGARGGVTHRRWMGGNQPAVGRRRGVDSGRVGASKKGGRSAFEKRGGGGRGGEGGGTRGRGLRPAPEPLTGASPEKATPRPEGGDGVDGGRLARRRWPRQWRPWRQPWPRAGRRMHGRDEVRAGGRPPPPQAYAPRKRGTGAGAQQRRERPRACGTRGGSHATPPRAPPPAWPSGRLRQRPGRAAPSPGLVGCLASP